MALRKLTAQQVRELAQSSLLACGASHLQASAIADMLRAAEEDGCSSHGLFRLPAFLEGCAGGRVDARAVPVVSSPLPAVVRVDARGGFAQAAEAAGLAELVSRARTHGVAMMGVANARGMSGAMWYPAEQLAMQGVVSIVCHNSPPYVAAAPGSARRVFGTNPMAFGWPRAGGLPPYVWDQASSVMARGEIEVHQRDGRPLPPGEVGVGPSGELSSDPAAILAGAQLPFGRHKGANLAAMIELLSAALFGSDLAVGQPEGAPFDTYSRGTFVLAIDPANLREEGSAAEQGEQLFQALLGGAADARLPGDRRREHRSRVAAGRPIEIPEELYARIGELVAAHATS
ncbi:hypothetical protein EMIHUDRAFT_462681 [Emiliania huxleyi CCMP1516]|uniref:Malate dehydrogenase n=3 Tax=Emiliania huxleyi TaxID=2903 RepID=A0A0D3K8B9_EMIH1|nr:hypothetical protein EMIHUDRAFT_462681 [Emiliania huxleyi CCMP1516]EOD32004.1 hypothetical protein EMIHUDRAFT_462681 [Emiliania huxleyi CCMP1516]|eukprot:XP_005784433.1 hypothetical protein EMIHUDRAFT_462681 [Emiliania huxleyi CCMP1516]